MTGKFAYCSECNHLCLRVFLACLCMWLCVYLFMWPYVNVDWISLWGRDIRDYLCLLNPPPLSPRTLNVAIEIDRLMFDTGGSAIQETSQTVLLLCNFCLFMTIWQIKQVSGSFATLRYFTVCLFACLHCTLLHIISKDDGSNFNGFSSVSECSHHDHKVEQR